MLRANTPVNPQLLIPGLDSWQTLPSPRSTWGDVPDATLFYPKPPPMMHTAVDAGCPRPAPPLLLGGPLDLAATRRTPPHQPAQACIPPTLGLDPDLNDLELETLDVETLALLESSV